MHTASLLETHRSVGRAALNKGRSLLGAFLSFSVHFTTLVAGLTEVGSGPEWVLWNACDGAHLNIMVSGRSERSAQTCAKNAPRSKRDDQQE